MINVTATLVYFIISKSHRTSTGPYDIIIYDIYSLQKLALMNPLLTCFLVKTSTYPLNKITLHEQQ